MRRPLFATTRSTGSQYVNLDIRYEHQKWYLPQVKSNLCCLHFINDGVLLYVPLQWFNLNSLLTGPELISDTYLALFLAQLQQEGKNQNFAPLFVPMSWYFTKKGMRKQTSFCRLFHICNPRKPAWVWGRADPGPYEGAAAAAAKANRRGWS